ncbi:bifunctional DNA-formamidopyrimidine glycosylase/DNA-(apurinic or apyrimidinic site) lyase [Alicyclobacillus fastidiosus]|uniref:Formamidopyrimidine-DNA glycosylase n=1 Tax=Alicyclobacillus fastidiosus TaxID=392011 RepID=A0ABV5AC06_9BACL|nr:bifunctional DNA-formamidopyrimidine glycosylase/DNA-(apurinic or apyrimidinic site) lyase [Alicyclobacillus fastidiosus]WEH10445.1 bifunctional DNA-formamidopyrimidine glycosylase/DNA-(apurinic or apyrimidinic site) lyase [Alicyclobacillus fastidiosus]
MPELPEVETVRRGLSALVVGKTIVYVHVHLPRIVRHPTPEEFEKRLVGRKVESIGRRGKYLLFDVPPYTLVSHLRMEGQYRVVPKDEPLALHTHVIFGLSDGTELRYRDVRQFGTMDLLTADETPPSGLVTLGPEPFDPALTPHVLYRSLHKRSAPVKSVLLDQSVLAGLGNIYVDEALFHAGVHPLTSANRIGQRRCEVLLKAIRDVLTRAIEAGGSSIRTYVNGYGRHGGFQIQLNAYGREGQPCLVCGQPIEKIRLGGRGTHYCPTCQPKSGRRKPQADVSSFRE